MTKINNSAHSMNDYSNMDIYSSNVTATWPSGKALHVKIQVSTCATFSRAGQLGHFSVCSVYLRVGF